MRLQDGSYAVGGGDLGQAVAMFRKGAAVMEANRRAEEIEKEEGRKREEEEKKEEEERKRKEEKRRKDNVDVDVTDDVTDDVMDGVDATRDVIGNDVNGNVEVDGNVKVNGHAMEAGKSGDVNEDDIDVTDDVMENKGTVIDDVMNVKERGEPMSDILDVTDDVMDDHGKRAPEPVDSTNTKYLLMSLMTSFRCT